MVSLEKALARHGIEPDGAGTWLVVGRRARKAARGRLGARVTIRNVEDVHEALEALSERGFDGCVAAAGALRDRPGAALDQLMRRLDRAPVFVLGRKVSPALQRAADERDVPVCRPVDRTRPPAGRVRRPAPIPRADLAHDAERIDPGRFAEGCLQRLGEPASLREYVLHALVGASGAERASLMMLEKTRRALQVRVGVGLDPDLVGSVRVTLGSGVAGRAASLGRALKGHAAKGGHRAYGGAAYVVLPLGAGPACLGVVNLTALPGDALPDDEAFDRWIRMGHHAGRALETAERLQLAEALVTRDEVTTLPNRRAFENTLRRELDRAGRAGAGLAVAMFDVDDFKRVNDELGHPIGDRVLLEVGRRLQAAFRDTDLVARWGGEEFVALLPGLGRGGSTEALGAVERARVLVAGRPFAVGPGIPPRRVTVSGGLAAYPVDGADREGIVSRADAALYEAKAAGKNTIRTARPEAPLEGDGAAPGEAPEAPEGG